MKPIGLQMPDDPFAHAAPMRSPAAVPAAGAGGAAAAPGGAAGMYGAGITAGAALVGSLLSARAQSEDAKRQAAIEAAKASGDPSSFQNMVAGSRNGVQQILGSYQAATTRNR